MKIGHTNQIQSLQSNQKQNLSIKKLTKPTN